MGWNRVLIQRGYLRTRKKANVEGNRRHEGESINDKVNQHSHINKVKPSSRRLAGIPGNVSGLHVKHCGCCAEVKLSFNKRPSRCNNLSQVSAN